VVKLDHSLLFSLRHSINQRLVPTISQHTSGIKTGYPLLHMVYLLPMKNTAHLKYTTFINNKMMYMYNDFNKSVHRMMSLLSTQLEQDLVILVCEFSK
jgi:hypothetical protein